MKHSGVSKGVFLENIIKEGITRHRFKQKKYEMRGNAISGYGIYATTTIASGEVVFRGEERSQRIVTLSHVQQNWNEEELINFKRYAYPLSEEVYILWDTNPESWAPQNHCCNANTFYAGLDVVATKKIEKGEELTLDYAEFLDDTMEPFSCSCKSENCRGVVTGRKNNSVTARAN